jgi:hypothetical protein
MSEVSPQQIADWKNTYGAIYSAIIRGQKYIFRAVTLKEFRNSYTDIRLSAPEREEALIYTAILSPDDPDFDNQPAGIVSQLAEEILEISGFQNPREASQRLEEVRAANDNVYTLMKAMILATMPTYKEEELDDLTFDQLLGKAVLAEKVMEVHQTVMTGQQVQLVLIDPEAEAEEVETERYKHAAQKKQGTAGYDDPIARRLHQALG